MDLKASGQCSKIVTINARRTTWCDSFWALPYYSTLLSKYLLQKKVQIHSWNCAENYIILYSTYALQIAATWHKETNYLFYQEIVLFITFNLNAEIFIIVLTVQQMINRHCLICPNSKLSSNVFFSKLLYGTTIWSRKYL